MKPDRVIVDNGVGRESPLWHAFQKWLGDLSAEYVFVAKDHKGIPDVEILDKLLNKGTILLTKDRVLHNHACARGLISFTLNEQGHLQRKPLKHVDMRRHKPLPSVLKELKDDYTTKLSELTLKLTNGMSEKELRAYRTRRRRIRSYFGSAANLSSVAITIGATIVKEKALCGYVIRIAGFTGVKGLRASEGYCVTSASTYDPAHPVIHALCASYYLHLNNVPTDLFIIPDETLSLCKTLLSAAPESIIAPSHRALHDMLRNISRLRLFPCVKGYFHDNMKQKLQQLSGFRNNEIQAIDFSAIVEKVNNELPEFSVENMAK